MDAKVTVPATELHLCRVAPFTHGISLQVRAQHSYGVNNALFHRLPVDPATGGLLKQFDSMDDMVNWLNTSLVSTIWNDPG